MTTEAFFKCDETIPERAIHIAVKGPGGCQRSDGSDCFIASNIATTPGDMTERGCTYAGCRGVVGGPVKDVIQLTHGPIGCAFFSWGYRPHLADSDFHMKYTFVTDMDETNIVFGGEKRLLKCIIEAAQEFPDAKGVFIYNTCSTALIGDDGKDVAKEAAKIIGKPVVFFDCEGFRGVSQSPATTWATRRSLRNWSARWSQRAISHVRSTLWVTITSRMTCAPLNHCSRRLA